MIEIPYPPQKYIDRFWSRVSKGNPGDCWDWTGTKTPPGYGRFNVPKGAVYAHRLSYILNSGTIPDGMCVCHTCDNPGCCNPAHLFAGTMADNMHDRDRKGRSKIGGAGENNPRAKLTAAQVAEIRSKYIPRLYPQEKLAKEYHVKPYTIYEIISFRKWKQVTQQSSTSRLIVAQKGA